MNKHCRKHKQTGDRGGEGVEGWGLKGICGVQMNKEGRGFYTSVCLQNKVLEYPREALSHLPLVGVVAAKSSQLLPMTDH